MKGITSELEYDAVNVHICVYKFGWGCNNGEGGGGGGVMISFYELRRPF